MVGIKEQGTEGAAPFFIYKADEEKRLVFGWASVAVTVDGEILEDRQQDMIDPADLEEAVYEYVLKFRDSGEEHISTLRKKGKLVESCVLTEEKQRAMGIPPGIVPVGWWIGFKIEDDAAWQKVKDGTYRMFSIEGKASREEVAKTATVAKTFNEILKFNPYHGKDGRFSNADAATMFTYKPGQGKMYDNAIAREKERQAGNNEVKDNIVTERLREVESEIKGQSFETAVAIRDNGGIVLWKNGDVGVNLTAEECCLLNGATFTHNHPDGNPVFSIGDIKAAVLVDMKEMRTITKDGKGCSLIKEAENIDLHTKVDFINGCINTLNQSAKYGRTKMRDSGVDEKLKNGEMTLADADRMLTEYGIRAVHQYLEKNATSYGYRYEYREGE